MTRDETVALFLECEGKRAEACAAALAEGKSKYDARNIAHDAAKAHWNAWAEARLAERKAMEADGSWAAKKKHGYCILQPKNDETRAWMEAAKANFSHCLFLIRGAQGIEETAGEEKRNEDAGPPVKSMQLEADSIDFRGFVFPRGAWFEFAIFTGNARFESAAFSGMALFRFATFTGNASFASAIFSADAGFETATFSRCALFNSVTFTGNAFFGTASFGKALFRNAIFSGRASFQSTFFTGDAQFESATFAGSALFGDAAFSGEALFRSATFTGNACFQSATFQNSASYRKAKFEQKAEFTSIKVDRAFDMTGAKFKQVPAFDQVDFKQAPNLGCVEFPPPCFWRRGEAALIAQYRAIRRMAIQGADYEREQMAFKGEVRSKRGTEHKPWHAAFWFGIAYDAFSDCGRSIARPLAIWSASWLAFAAIYAWNAGVGIAEWGAACAGDGASKALKALTLSAANALPLIGAGRSEVAREFYAECLALPHMSAWSPILQISQTLWSAVLLFLFLLALRNQFKIK
jgi:hypothetical protein